MSATLFADRFLRFEEEPGACAIDLASGEQVTLRRVTFDQRDRLQAWLQQCARLMELRVPREEGNAGVLVDFGVAGRDQHFEALAIAAAPLAWPRKPAPPSGAVDALLQRLEEVLDTGVSGRPRLVEFRLPPAVPGPQALNLLARVSRLRGYVPVCPGRLRALAGDASLSASVLDVLRGRHAVVLDEACAGSSTGRSAAALLVSLALDSDRPHVLLVLARERGGYRSEAAGLRTREEQAGYLVSLDTPPPPPLLQSERHPPWGRQAAARSGDRPRSRLLLALESAGRGRHASALRTLRETLAMAARRDDFGVAGEVALMLGRVLLARGQVGEASGAFESARLYFDRAGLPPGSVLAAIFVGLAWTDAGRWLEAESAIRAALIAADTLRDADSATFGALALARCLLWQGRPAEALEVLPPDGAGGAAGNRVSEPRGAAFVAASPIARPRLDDRVVRPCLAARIAVASGDLRAAGLAASAARERATVGSGPAELALACTAMAGVYAALGDTEALRRQVEEGLRAARLAHAPLRALRLRALLAEGLLRAGKASEARALVARLGRLDRRSLPAVVRVAVDRAVDWRAPAAVTPGSRAEAAASPARDLVEPVVEILGLCHAIEDEEALLRKVTATLRARLRAAVAACLGLSDGVVAPVAFDGRDPAPSEVAQRAADAALPIAPAATLSGLEGAVPVHCGGRVIGALACRWAADVSPNWPAPSGVLQAAAAAVSPFLRAVLDRRAVRPAAPGESCADEIVGDSAALRTLREEIERAARAPFNVVIEGESGSGKELVARAVHRLGPRRHRRLCAINCAALTDELLEAELFGHARGAFTGAIAERKGLFEEADGGTLVFDEVGELTPRAQAKLLRAIQEGEVRRLGENYSRPVDVRIVAASNRPLRAAAESGAFRRDLLYRLEVIRIVVPPLRERAEDIPILAAHFWQQAIARIGSRATLAPATLAVLAQYDWPGNVRELQNVMSALAVSAARRGSVFPDRLPAVIAGQVSQGPDTTLEEARRQFEARFVRAAMARAGGHRTVAARDLGLTRQGLAKLLARLGIDV